MSEIGWGMFELALLLFPLFVLLGFLYVIYQLIGWLYKRCHKKKIS
jgi:hypothetical protein